LIQIPSSSELNLFAVMATAAMYMPFKDMVNAWWEHYRKKTLMVEEGINVFVFLVMYLVFNGVLRWLIGFGS